MQVMGRYSLGRKCVEGYGHVTIPLQPGNYDFQVLLGNIHHVHVHRAQNMDSYTYARNIATVHFS